MESDRHIGTVVWFDAKRGYGFLARPGENDLFVHWSDITCDGFKTLAKGQQVAYSIGLNQRGRPKAIEVVVVAAAVVDEKTV